MQVICEQQALSAALSLVSRCVPSRPTHPILANVHLSCMSGEAGKGKLRVTGFDLTLGISIDIDAYIDVRGEITVPARLILEIITKMPVGEIELIVVDDEEIGLSVKIVPAGSTGKFSIRAIAATEYPQFPEISAVQAVTVPAGMLSEGIGKTVFATSTDEVKQVLVGVHMEVIDESLEMAATDGHRLTVIKLNSDSELHPIEVTIPSRSLSELQRLLSKKESSEMVSIIVADGMAKFQIVDGVLVTRTKEGQYPKYNQLIPKQFTRSFVCDRKQLSASLDRIGVFVSAGNSIVTLDVDSVTQSVTISCEQPDVGSAKESMSAQVSGSSISLCLNIKYLREGLNAMDSKEIIVNINESLQPVIINPLDGSKMTYLCMPVQSRS